MPSLAEPIAGGDHLILDAEAGGEDHLALDAGDQSHRGRIEAFELLIQR